LSTAAIIEIVIASLGFLSKLLNMADAEKLRNDGRSEAINQALANIARMTMKANDAEREVARMSDADIARKLSEYSFDDSGHT
jgi:hypothetical protein